MARTNILIPIAPGQTPSPALDELVSFADKTGAPVRLLSVVEQFQMLGVGNISLLDLLKRSIEEQRKQLIDIASSLTDKHPKLRVHIEVLSGKPFIEIIKYASSINASVIGLDASRSHKASTCQYGSTTRHLMRKSDVPVWVARPCLCQGVRRIAAAVDVVSSDLEVVHLNERIISKAKELAEHYDAELRICHAWKLDAEGYLRSWARYNDTEIAKVAQEEEYQRRLRLEALTERLGLSLNKVSLALPEGDAQSQIPSLVEREKVELLVMGTLCRSNLSGFIMGNTAERMLDNVRCSVLTIKPEGFHSPVLE
ncbi:universal stress protein [Ferrimonas futtsuensis]|uniref:universal stress protein n=1 Tax=Ferrimonas futtsuensis TaxID=364764 RepID=UPI00041CF03F|nr:universal stress protein [Ferrimonas futtsuensis]